MEAEEARVDTAWSAEAGVRNAVGRGYLAAENAGSASARESCRSARTQNPEHRRDASGYTGQHLLGDAFILGLGVSGTQVVEGIRGGRSTRRH